MKRLFGVISILVAFAMVSGCSQVKNVCEKLDECNQLAVSVDDCVDQTERDYDLLTDNDQEDWDNLAKDCLDFESCERFMDCMY